MDFLYNSWLWIREEHTSGNSVHPTATIHQWAQLIEMGIKGKTFQEIPGVIKDVASRFITLFYRRLDFLKSKRGNMAHSDFLLLLENKIDQTNFKDWSRDQMCATLFLTYADVEMSKVVTSLMSKDRLDMVELRGQIRSLESSPWYKEAKQESVKLSGAQGGTPPAPPGGRCCSSCNRSTYNTSDCWGFCKW